MVDKRALEIDVMEESTPSTDGSRLNDAPSEVACGSTSSLSASLEDSPLTPSQEMDVLCGTVISTATADSPRCEAHSAISPRTPTSCSIASARHSSRERMRNVSAGTFGPPPGTASTVNHNAQALHLSPASVKSGRRQTIATFSPISASSEDSFGTDFIPCLAHDGVRRHIAHERYTGAENFIDRIGLPRAKDSVCPGYAEQGDADASPSPPLHLLRTQFMDRTEHVQTGGNGMMAIRNGGILPLAVTGRHLHNLSQTSEPTLSTDPSTTATASLPPSRGISRPRIPAPLPLQPRREILAAQRRAKRTTGLPKLPGPVGYDSPENVSLKKRSQLIRTTRKAEQTLGESLSEDAVERYIVEPSLNEKVILTRFVSEWPATPAPDSTVPEWQREDCLPRRQHGPETSGATVASPRGPKSWIRDLGKPAKVPKKLEIRVQREIHVTESWIPGPPKPPPPMPLQCSNSRKARRAPKDLHVRVAREVHVSEQTTRHSRTRSSLGLQVVSTSSPVTGSTPSPSPLFEDAEEIARRARRLQLAKLQRLLGTPVPPHMVADVDVSVVEQESTSTAATTGNDAAEDLNKQTQGLREPLPHDLLSPISDTDSAVFESYRHSIHQLTALIEHDQDRLDTIVDELDAILPLEVSTTIVATPSPTTWRFNLIHSPSPSPLPSPTAWRRNRKSRYSDEQRDLAFSPNLAARRTATLDGVIEEMWTSMQAEVKRGSLRVAEANKLVEMMGILRKKRESAEWAELE